MGLETNCSGQYGAYCEVALDGGESVRPEWGNSCGDGWYEVRDGLVCVYSPRAGEEYSKRGIGSSVGIDKGVIVSGGRAVLGVSELDHSSSYSGRIEVVTAAAESGGAYSVVGLNDGGRGRGAWRRGSGA